MGKTETPDEVYETLLALITNPRERESLERVKKACDYLEPQGLKISASSVERYCVDREWGGPKAQSIRNSVDVLKRYLTSRESRQKLAPRKKRGELEPRIADETVRAYVNLLKEERDEERAARLRIEAGLRTIPGIPVDDLIRVGFGGKPAAPLKLTGRLHLPHVAREAILRLLDGNALGDAGLQLHKDRLRQTSTGNVLLEKTQVLALRNLLSSEADEQSGPDKGDEPTESSDQ